MFDLEETVMGLIINAGMSRSLCFEALRQATAETGAALGAAYAGAQVILTDPARWASG